MALVLAQDLRAAVLQAAMQGKLTEQLPEDGDARDLLADIKAEKERLIKEKKIKKEKPLDPISQDEIPFDIPDNWLWVRLGECISLLSGADFAPDKYNSSGSGTPYMTGASNIIDGHLLINRWTDEPRCIATNGDLLIVCKGSGYGKTVICDVDQVHIARQFMSVRQAGFLDQDYIKSFIDNQFSFIKSKGQGVIPGIERSTILNLQFPLPPLPEQHRIVTRIEELMAKIDEYEELEKQLAELKVKFPGDMKATVLQAAMEGKLTEQLPEDGSAQNLLDQINIEKERLIKEKKIKKEQAVGSISETPFDIPDSWEWTYLGTIFNHIAGKALNAKNTKGTKHQYITTSNVYWDHFELDKLKEMYYTDDEVEKYSIKKGDLLVLEGGDVGRSAIWDLDISYCIQNHIHRLRPYVPVEIKYFYYAMMLFKKTGMVNGKGIGIKGLSAKALHTVLIPLPPIAEQHRIVEKLDKLLPLCDELVGLA